MNLESSAVNFSYLLLDYYKSLNIKEDELAVILMIDHLLASTDDFITTDLLAMKMNLDERRIDEIMANLLNKKYIEFELTKDKALLTLNPLKKILYSFFKQSIFTQEELDQQEGIDQKRTEYFEIIEEFFGRTLSPFEMSIVDEWIAQDIDEDIVKNAIKDAIRYDKKSVRTIDKYVISRLKKEDNLGNAK